MDKDPAFEILVSTCHLSPPYHIYNTIIEAHPNISLYTFNKLLLNWMDRIKCTI